MTCGVGNDLQEMEEKSVSAGFAEFLRAEAERWNNPICFLAAWLACSLNSLIS